MEIQSWQIIVLTLLAFFAIVEHLSLSILQNQPVIIGAITGLVMGDVTMGLAVGATLQLMILGVGTYGGSSIPDYMTGSIVGTVFAILSQKGVGFGIGLAIPVGLLMIQLDILARFSNVFFQKKVDSAIAANQINVAEKWAIAGFISWGLSRALPVFVMLIFGEAFVKVLLDYIPEWLTGGLQVAGGVLPALGIAILLRYLPTKVYLPYLIIGFFLVAFLKVSIIGVSIVGLALALLQYKKRINQAEQPNVVATSQPKKELYDGEYEN